MVPSARTGGTLWYPPHDSDVSEGTSVPIYLIRLPNDAEAGDVRRLHRETHRLSIAYRTNMIGLSPNAPLPAATIPKTSSSRLPSAARATKATLSITHGSRSRRHKLSYNDKATLNNLVRISELQKQSHWAIENDCMARRKSWRPSEVLLGRAVRR